MIKNKVAKYVYHGILAITCILSLVYIIIDMTKTADTLVYYTNLSNLAVIIFFGVYFSFEIINKLKGTHYGKNKWFYTAKGAITMCIFITGVIYHFLLAKPSEPGFWEAGNLIKHYIVPILVLFDWVLFDSRERYLWWSPLTNTILPILYLVFALIRGAIVGPEHHLQYCYGFINVTEYGAGQVAINCVVICLAVIAISYLFYLVDQIPAIQRKLKEKKSQEQNQQEDKK